MRLLALFAVLGAVPPPMLPAAEPLPAYHEALRLLRDHKHEAAARELQDLIAGEPSFARAYPRLLGALEPSGRREEALAFFSSLPAPYADYGTALFHGRQDPELAGRQLRRVIEAAPDFLPAYTELVNLARGGGALAETAAWLETRPRTAGSLYGLGYLCQQQGEFDKARGFLDQAAAIQGFSWEILNARYFVDYLSDRQQEALATLDKMLQRAQSTGDLEWQSRILGRAGVIHSDQGDYDQAEGLLRQAAGIAVDLGERAGEQSIRGNLGLVYVYLAKYPEALVEIQRALELCRDLGNRLSEGRNLGLLANVHAEMADYPKAITAFTQAIAIARETEDRPSEADQLASLSLVHAALGEHPKALQRVTDALRVAREIKHPWLEGRFLQIQGLVLLDLGRLAEAAAAFERGLRLARKLGDKLGEAARLAYAAQAHALAGQDALALPRFNQALAIARQIGARLVEAQISNDLAKVQLRRGDLKGASRNHERALAIGSETHMPEVVWRAHAGLAAVLQKSGRPKEAVGHYRRALEAIEMVRSGLHLSEEKAGFLEDKIQVYRRLAGLLAGSEKDEAFRVAESGKARALLDMLAEARSRVERGLDPGLAARRRQIEARLSRLQARLSGEYARKSPSPSRLRSLEAELSAADDEYRSLRREVRLQKSRPAALEFPEPARLGDIQRLLDPGTALLEYSLGEEASLLFAVTRDEILVARVPAAPVLRTRVERLRESIAASPSRVALASYFLEARALYRDLVQPAERLLAGKREIVIVPDGILHYLPFGALLGGRGDVSPPDVTRARFLVQDHAVSYVPSASVLAVLKRHRQVRTEPASQLLVYADPAYGPASPRLEQSRGEAESIARLFAPDKVRVLTGAAASEENVKAEPAVSRARFLHFAVHGVLNERRPDFSGLALSPSTSQGEDGLLQAFEILNLELNAELVVLSACETGLGKEVRGEGLVGLTQAFLYAGTPAVVASLWKIEDRSASDLMGRFYRHLSSGERSAAEALRQAQLELIRGRTFAHPHFWAPFILSGASPR